MSVNKVVQEFHQKHFEPIKSWKVQSSHRHSDTGQYSFYEVALWSDGSWTCECAGSFYGQNRKNCKHIRQKMDELAEEKFNK